MQHVSAANTRIARNTVFLYVRMIIVLLVSLYTTRALLSALGVEDYGIYNVVAGFVTMFAFLNTSFVATIQRYYNYELGKTGLEGVYRVYISSAIIQLVVAFIVVALAETIGLWYLNNKMVIPVDRLSSARLLFHCSILSMALTILQVPYSSVIMAFEKLDYYAIVGVIDTLLKLLIVIALDYLGGDRLEKYAILLLCVASVVFLLYFVYAKNKLIKGKIKLVIDKALLKNMIMFSGWSVMGSFAQVVRNQGINIILNLFFGPVVNAARGVSFQVKGALSGFIANTSLSVRPQLVSSYASGNTSRSISLMFSISKINFLILYLLALPICLEMNYVLHIWLGNNVPEYTVIFSRLILVIALVDVFNGPVTMIMYASGKIGLYNVVTSFLGLFVLPLAYFVLKAGYPPFAVYLMSLFISVVVQLSSVIIMKKLIAVSIRDYFKRVLLPSILILLCSLPIALVPFLVINESLLRVVIVGMVSVVSVGALGYYVGLNNSERELLHSFVGRIIKRKQ